MLPVLLQWLCGKGSTRSVYHSPRPHLWTVHASVSRQPASTASVVLSYSAFSNTGRCSYACYVYCRQAVQCQVPSCVVAYHVSCGRDAGLVFELKDVDTRVRYLSYCPKHQKPQRARFEVCQRVEYRMRGCVWGCLGRLGDVPLLLHGCVALDMTACVVVGCKQTPVHVLPPTWKCEHEKRKPRLKPTVADIAVPGGIEYVTSDAPGTSLLCPVSIVEPCTCVRATLARTHCAMYCVFLCCGTDRCRWVAVPVVVRRGDAGRGRRRPAAVCVSQALFRGLRLHGAVRSQSRGCVLLAVDPPSRRRLAHPLHACKRARPTCAIPPFPPRSLPGAVSPQVYPAAAASGFIQSALA